MASVNARLSGQIPAGAYFTYVLHTRRVNKVNGTNKRLSFSVLVVVGNGKGSAQPRGSNPPGRARMPAREPARPQARPPDTGSNHPPDATWRAASSAAAGLGMGKDLQPQAALMKATHAARKNLVHVDRFDGRTIFHDFESHYRGTKSIVIMRRPFSGTCCNWIAWKIFSAFGISDVSCTIHGSKNNINQAHAIVNGLIRMVTPQQVADKRGKRVLDITSRGNRIAFPSKEKLLPF